MKRITHAILASLFVIGVLVVPTLHRIHCDDNQDAHEVAKCPICQLAHTTVITTASVIAPIAGFIHLGDAALPQLFIPSVSLCGAAMARAPPAS